MKKLLKANYVLTIVATFLLYNFGYAKHNRILAQRNLPKLITSLSVAQNQTIDSQFVLEFKIQKPGTQAELEILSAQKRELEVQIILLESNEINNELEKQQIQQQINKLDREISSLFSKTLISEKNVIDAQPQKANYNNSSVIAILLDREGSQKLVAIDREITGTKRFLRLFIDGKLIPIPVVTRDFSITGLKAGRLVISGNFTASEAENIATRIIEANLKLNVSSFEREANNLIKTADEQYQQENLTEALANYNRALEINPSRLDVYLNRGKILMALDNYEAAVNNYETLIDLNPIYLANREIFLSLTRSYLLKGDRQKTLDIWELKAKQEPYFSSIVPMGQALVLLYFQDFEAAINKLNRALIVPEDTPEANLKNIFVYWYRGLTYEHLNDRSAAINDFKKVKQFDLSRLIEALETMKPANLASRDNNNPQLENYQKLKVRTAQFYYLKSLACDRLQDPVCAKQNQEAAKKILEVNADSELKEYFSTIENSLEQLLENTPEIIGKIVD